MSISRRGRSLQVNFKSMKNSRSESVFEVAKPTTTTAIPLPSPREGTKRVTIKVDHL